MKNVKLGIFHVYKTHFVHHKEHFLSFQSFLPSFPPSLFNRRALGTPYYELPVTLKDGKKEKVDRLE
jgi:hypothetical protein